MNRKIADKGQLGLLLVLMALSTIIDGLDASIVNVALPTISDDFGISVGDSSWVTLTYIVALAALLLPAAKAARNGLMKRFFIWGVAVFTLCSALCGIAPNFNSLVVFRLFQGVGAALMTAAVPIMIVDLLPDDRKGVGMGVLAVASGIAIILGPSVGGFITSFVSWEWIFYINLPLGVLTVLIAGRILPRDEGYDPSRNPDLVNSVLMVLAIGWGLTFVQNSVDPSLSWTLVALCAVGSVICFAVLIVRARARPRESLVSPGLLRRRDFQLLSLAFTMTCMIIMGTEYVLPYFLQISGGYSVSDSGLLLSVASVFAILLSVPVGRWCDSHGCKVPSVLAGVGRLLFCLIFLLVSPKGDLPLLVIGLAVMGCSMAFAGTGLATALIHHSDDEYQGEAATFLLEINYAAASVGVALYAVLFQVRAGDGDVSALTMSAVHDGFDTVMMFGIALSIVAILCTACVRNIVPKKDDA